MSEVQNVRLPNGQIAKNVPIGMSKAELLDKLARNKTISTEDATAWGLTTQPQQAPAVERSTPVADSLEANPQGADNIARLPASMRPPTIPTTAELGAQLESIGSTVAGNLDVPGSIAGSVVGAKAGTPLGPMGILGGTIAGGAIGGFGGDILSDYFMSEDPNIPEATKNAAMGVGFDLATLGLASKFKTAAKAMGFDANEIAKLWKTYTTKNKKVQSPNGTAYAVGSDESKAQTQALLQEKGGSLTAYQTGKASSAQRIAEGVGEVGIVSSAGYKGQTARNAQILADELQAIVNTGWASSKNNMGSTIAGSIDAGKQGASVLYDQSMQKISDLTHGVTVNPKWIVGQFDNWRKEGQKSWGSSHSTEALKLVNGWEESLSQLKSMSVPDLLAFQKKLNGQIADLGTFGADAVSKRASRDLADLSAKVRTTTEALIKSKSPKASKLYTEANAAYGSAMEGLLPKLNASQITSAKKGDYESLARLLEGQNPDKVEALLKSIDESYVQARLAGVDPTEYGGVATAREARDLIKGQWVSNIFGEITTEGFDPKSFKGLASFYEKPANKRVAQAIMGDDFGRFKMVLNAIDESTEKQSGFLGALVLRGKEHEAISGALQGGLALTGPFAAAPVLLGPVMLRHIVSNPKAVAKLLEGNKRAGAAAVGGKTGLASEIMNTTAEALMEMFTPEQQAEIRQNTRGG